MKNYYKQINKQPIFSLLSSGPPQIKTLKITYGLVWDGNDNVSNINATTGTPLPPGLSAYILLTMDLSQVTSTQGFINIPPWVKSIDLFIDNNGNTYHYDTTSFRTSGNSFTLEFNSPLDFNVSNLIPQLIDCNFYYTDGGGDWFGVLYMNDLSLDLVATNISVYNNAWNPVDLPNSNVYFRNIQQNVYGTTVVGVLNDSDFDYLMNGFYTSKDSGTSWVKTYSTSTTYFFPQLATDTSGIYWYMGDLNNHGTMIISTDGANSWTEQSITVNTIKYIICNGDGDTVYTLNSDGTELWKSTDFGQSFTQTSFTSTTGSAWGMCASVDCSIIYIATESAIWYSTDNANSWNIMTTAPNGGTVNYNYLLNYLQSAITCSADGSIVTAMYFDTNTQYIIETRNGGTNWNYLYSTVVQAGTNILGIYGDADGNFMTLVSDYYTNKILHNLNVPAVISPVNGVIACGSFNAGQFFIANYGRVFLTTNYVDYNRITLTDNKWTAVAINNTGNKMLAVTYNDNIYSSNDYGSTWVAINPTNEIWTCVGCNPTGNVIVAGGIDSGTLITSFDGGSTWTTGDMSSSWSGVCTNSNGSIMYACANNNEYIYNCTDSSGSVWTQLNTPSNNWSSIACDNTGNLVIACSYGDAVYYSSDAGATWNQITSVELAPYYNAWQSVSSSYNGRILMAAATDNMSYGFVRTSTDFGITWITGNLEDALDTTAVSGNGNVLLCGADNVASRLLFVSNFTDPSQWVNAGAPSGNWKSLATNVDGTVSMGASLGGQIYINIQQNVVCFKENTLILTLDGYVAIQDIKKGDRVKTLKSGFVPVCGVGVKTIDNPARDIRMKDQLYVCPKDNFPELTEDLVITGAHAILVDEFPENIREQTKDLLGRVFVTEGKYRLPACLDKRTQVYPVKGQHTIYHIALENQDYYMNYGIYANGLLVETCSKRYLKELSGMQLK
jgi:hypothetical protein